MVALNDDLRLYIYYEFDYPKPFRHYGLWQRLDVNIMGPKLEILTEEGSLYIFILFLLLKTISKPYDMELNLK